MCRKMTGGVRRGSAVARAESANVQGVLKNNFRKGPLRQLTAEWLNTVADVLSFLSVVDAAGNPAGRIIRDRVGRNWKLVITGGGSSFSGAVERNGQWYYGLHSNASMPYVVVPLDNRDPYESAGPMPNPNPANEVWYRKEFQAGDIHVGSNR